LIIHATERAARPAKMMVHGTVRNRRCIVAVAMRLKAASSSDVTKQIVGTVTPSP
jgi:hypothetical protein